MESLFKQVAQLGSGSFATVYKAIVPESLKKKYHGQEFCALKYIDLSKSKDALKESSFLMDKDNRNCPYIVKCFDSFTSMDGKTFILILEYCKNGTLKEHSSYFRKNPKEMVRVFVQLLKALDFVHSKGFLHRDVKPENILLDDQMNVKLADFGIIKNINNTLGRTEAGSYYFMAPEVSSKGEYQFPADIWSACATFYYLYKDAAPYCDTTVRTSFQLQNNKNDRSKFIPLNEKQCPDKTIRDIINTNLVLDENRRKTAKEIIGIIEGGYVSPEFEEGDMSQTQFGKSSKFESPAKKFEETRTIESKQYNNSVMNNNFFKSNHNHIEDPLVNIGSLDASEFRNRVATDQSASKLKPPINSSSYREMKRDHSDEDEVLAKLHNSDEELEFDDSHWEEVNKREQQEKEKAKKVIAEPETNVDHWSDYFDDKQAAPKNSSINPSNRNYLESKNFTDNSRSNDQSVVFNNSSQRKGNDNLMFDSLHPSKESAFRQSAKPGEKLAESFLSNNDSLSMSRTGVQTKEITRPFKGNPYESSDKKEKEQALVKNNWLKQDSHQSYNGKQLPTKTEAKYPRGSEVNFKEDSFEEIDDIKLPITKKGSEAKNDPKRSRFEGTEEKPRQSLVVKATLPFRDSIDTDLLEEEYLLENTDLIVERNKEGLRREAERKDAERSKLKPLEQSEFNRKAAQESKESWHMQDFMDDFEDI